MRLSLTVLINISFYFCLLTEVIIANAIVPSVWKTFFSTGTYGEVDIGWAVPNTYFSLNKIFVRYCQTCSTSHQVIFYKRISPVPEDFSVYSNALTVWSSHNNILNIDFKLYSTFEDLQLDRNSWQSCNYDDYFLSIGFPRDCGPLIPAEYQWNSLATHSKESTFKGYRFDVYLWPNFTPPCIKDGCQSCDLSSFNNITTGVKISAYSATDSEGRVVKGYGPECFLVQNGIRRSLPNWATFLSLNMDPASIINLGDAIDDIPLGEPYPAVL